MADVENVIYAIERCTCHVPDACRDCPYDAGHPYNECVEMLLKDVLELLREQEAVKPIEPIYQGDDSYVCENCGETVGWEEIECYGIGKIRYKYCPGCGRAVKWE